MIKCPQCNSETTVHTEEIFVERGEYEFKKRGKGIKKSNEYIRKFLLKHAEDIRIFLVCENCNYRSDNFNNYGIPDDLANVEEEIKIILKQINGK